ncbi:TPA: branched-chain amino acid aminotransferase [Acinetobacter baumannii]|uniref:branched-chain amino acid aminotransferase n=1 Tax=Acinetobacter calcoaceticus/baumannii complex TaxID=909768 RepID=UPI002446D6A6|nr:MULTISPECIES: branched-chain amino acid aminotransferase [Acinetobacter calcoaceticus/baumannii complex]MDH2544600.1 branched-chain amino acid aminotransferase [Acinetobacter baumannii]MDO7218914.1 branched-chain amino acid aminotransferase [Acinetobacter nosocomialis]MDO7473983.1 branched-chain amino acid aminotransferase [Acinetobacter baumannii]MDV7659591.1 branched-chain amino acid aminotransferase [Acinetobacter baumannii]
MSENKIIPFDCRDGFIWLDGQFVDWKDAKIHVLTHGLHYGSCVYEGQRAYSGKVFKLREHTERLYRSAAIMDFKIPFSIAEIEAATKELLLKNGLVDGYVRPVVWRGPEQMSTSARNSKIHMAIACWHWGKYFDSSASKGIKLTIADWRRPPPSSSPFEAKSSGHYMIATLSKHQAENKGFHDALMLDWRGQVAEATSANIFFTQGNTLHTPIPDCFLNGITRQTVISLARSKGYDVVERVIFPEELDKFDECFLTGTAAEITPVRSINNYEFTPDKICQDMIHSYQSLTQNKENKND